MPAASCRWARAPTTWSRRCPCSARLPTSTAETVSRVGSHSLSFDQIHALAAKIAAVAADGVIVTQGTDTLEETAFLLDLLVERDIPVIVTAAMRNPALTSADGPGNLLAAVRVACDPWIRAHAKALGVMAVMLDEVYAAADVDQGASHAPQCLRLAADRAARRAGRRPRGAARPAGARRHRGGAPQARQSGRRRPAGGVAVDGARRARPSHRSDAERARSAGLSRRRGRRDGRRPRARTPRRSDGTPCRSYTHGHLAARRRRADVAAYIWWADLGDRLAQARA